MKRFLLGVMLLCIAAIPMTVMADMDVLANLPKETKFLIRADAVGLLKSELGATLTMTHDVKLQQIKQFIRQHVGVDLDLVDHVWVASWKKDTAVIIMKGHFDAGQLRATFGMGEKVKEVERSGCLFAAEFVDNKKGTKQLGAVIDDRTMAFGDRASVNHFLNVMVAKTGKLSPENKKLVKFRKKADHVVATTLVDLAELPDFDKDIADAVKEVWLTVQLDDNINVTITVEASNASKAEGVEMVVRGLARLKGDSADVRKNVLLHRLIQGAILKRHGATVTAESTIQGAFIQQLAQSMLKK